MLVVIVMQGVVALVVVAAAVGARVDGTGEKDSVSTEDCKNKSVILVVAVATGWGVIKG